MHRVGRFVLLCLLLVLLPLRSLLAAGQLGCEPVPVPMQEQHAGHDHQSMHGDAHNHAAKPCKLCAPCCLAAAPPPVLTLDTPPAAPALRVAQAPAERWAGVVPPLPDPPPRG
ncbi:hypothetical protein [Roseateles sp. P5_E1]